MQPRNFEEAKIDRLFTRPLNLSKHVEEVGWRNACLLLPEVNHEDRVLDCVLDMGFDHLQWNEKEREKTIQKNYYQALSYGLLRPFAEGIGFIEDAFKGWNGCYFQIKPFQDKPLSEEADHVAVILRNRAAYSNWELPKGFYIPTRAFRCRYGQFSVYHYGPCTLIC